MTGAQLLRDSIYEKNKVDIDFERFTNHTLFNFQVVMGKIEILRAIILISHPDRAPIKKFKQKEKEKVLVQEYLLQSAVMVNSNFLKLLAI